MGIGLGVILLLIGLILKFDVINIGSDFVDEGPLGWILIVVGILAIVLALVMNAQRQRTTTRVEDDRNPPPAV
ncbi:MAG TPA: DUF6458 family protein [Marmoricola sp.]|jgi:uncharacterized membrane protein HdeD (DUF308 family)|nr:DUF6458 family protein [Marmoricola sp.]